MHLVVLTGDDELYIILLRKKVGHEIITLQQFCGPPSRLRSSLKDMFAAFVRHSNLCAALGMCPHRGTGARANKHEAMEEANRQH